MLFTSIVTSAFLATGVLATMGASSSSSSSSSASNSTSSTASQVQVQVVKVSNANGSLTYNPEEITAAPGSFVQFQFWPKNHTVTQSTFDAPCVPLTQTMTNATSMIKSGFVPIAADAIERPVYTIRINDTKPLWLYCGQTGHCAKGMVMAINVNNSSPKTLAAYKQKALAFKAPDSGSSSSSSSSTSSSSGSSESASSSSSGAAASSSAPAVQTTNAAAKPVAGWLGLALTLVAGFAVTL